MPGNEVLVSGLTTGRPLEVARTIGIPSAMRELSQGKFSFRKIIAASGRNNSKAVQGAGLKEQPA